MTAEAWVNALASLGWLFFMFAPLEKAFKANDQKFVRPGFITDLFFFFGQYLIFSLVAVALISAFANPISHLPGVASLQVFFASLDTWLQIVLVVAAGDFMVYWAHRAQHRFEFLWRFHSVHHTTTHLDWLAAHREHPLDGFYTQTIINVPALVFGIGLGEWMGVIVFRGLWAIFIHSNVRIPLGPLRFLVGSPALHRWHHAKSRHVGNYANLGPWMDVLFGTYHLPDHEPEFLGIEEPHEENYAKLLIKPLIPGALSDQNG